MKGQRKFRVLTRRHFHLAAEAQEEGGSSWSCNNLKSILRWEEDWWPEWAIDEAARRYAEVMSEDGTASGVSFILQMDRAATPDHPACEVRIWSLLFAGEVLHGTRIFPEGVVQSQDNTPPAAEGVVVVGEATRVVGEGGGV